MDFSERRKPERIEERVASAIQDQLHTYYGLFSVGLLQGEMDCGCKEKISEVRIKRLKGGKEDRLKHGND